MAGLEDVDQSALLREIAAAIHRFLQTYPNHYASRALAHQINRTVAGDDVGDDERALVLLTLVRAVKDGARDQRFGR